MTTEQILREQIKELEKLIDLKNKTISELEIKLITPKLTFPQLQPYCFHEYDPCVFPSKCKKCGYSNYVYTYATNQATANRS